jgi:hypothetical protein
MGGCQRPLLPPMVDRPRRYNWEGEGIFVVGLGGKADKQEGGYRQGQFSHRGTPP